MCGFTDKLVLPYCAADKTLDKSQGKQVGEVLLKILVKRRNNE